ncbi:MAG TPA: biopolymer transporter ExbD [Asticcacaulis sp.]|nr:biopolymer transporter ExbD [Asticcacaulis sp.]
MGAKLSGGGGNSKFHVEANAEINVTPFVDVMLVLLIIFMVAAPLASVSIEVKLPRATAKPQELPPKPIYISLKKDTSLYVGDDETTLDTLGDDLKQRIGARDPDQERIFIRCDKGTRYAEFMKVMNKLQDNGFYSVALQGEDAGQ